MAKVYIEIDDSELDKIVRENYFKENIGYIYEQVETACTHCANNPKNGGSGVCNCILGTPVIT